MPTIVIDITVCTELALSSVRLYWKSSAYCNSGGIHCTNTDEVLCDTVGCSNGPNITNVAVEETSSGGVDILINVSRHVQVTSILSVGDCTISYSQC